MDNKGRKTISSLNNVCDTENVPNRSKINDEIEWGINFRKNRNQEKQLVPVTDETLETTSYNQIKKTKRKKRRRKPKISAVSEPVIFNRNTCTPKQYYTMLSRPRLNNPLPEIQSSKRKSKLCSPRYVQLALPTKQHVLNTWQNYENVLAPENILWLKSLLYKEEGLAPRDAVKYFSCLDAKRKKAQKKKAKRMKKEQITKPKKHKVINEIGELAKCIVTFFADKMTLNIKHNHMIITDLIKTKLVGHDLIKPYKRNNCGVPGQTLHDVLDQLSVWLESNIVFEDEDLEQEGSSICSTYSDLLLTISESMESASMITIRSSLEVVEEAESILDEINDLTEASESRIVTIASSEEAVIYVGTSVMEEEEKDTFEEANLNGEGFEEGPNNIEQIEEEDVFHEQNVLTQIIDETEQEGDLSEINTDAEAENEEIEKEGKIEDEEVFEEEEVYDGEEKFAGEEEFAKEEEFINEEEFVKEEEFIKDEEFVKEEELEGEEKFEGEEEFGGEEKFEGEEEFVGEEKIIEEEIVSELQKVDDEEVGSKLNKVGDKEVELELKKLGDEEVESDIEKGSDEGEIPDDKVGIKKDKDRAHSIVDGILKDYLNIIKEEVLEEVLKPEEEEAEEEEEEKKLIHVQDHAADATCCVAMKKWAIWLAEVARNTYSWCQWIQNIIAKIRLYAAILKGEVKTPEGNTRILYKEEWNVFREALETDIAEWIKYNLHVKDLSDKIIESFQNKRVICCAACLESKLIVSEDSAHEISDQLAEAIKKTRYWRSWLENIVDQARKLCSLENNLPTSPENYSSEQGPSGSYTSFELIEIKSPPSVQSSDTSLYILEEFK